MKNWNFVIKTLFLLVILLIFKNTEAQFNCGSNITTTHNSNLGGNAYLVAPQTKNITYGTVLTNLSGTNKCWTLKNLGADSLPLSVNDNREIAAGWYWQFNRKQGYNHDGINRTPNTIWNSSINENSDWLLINDPCSILLGNGWRIPTNSEWTNADINGNWNMDADCFQSVLKMHTAGFLTNYGNLSTRGYNGDFWSSNQSSNTQANRIGFNPTECYSNYNQPYKSYALNLRCIYDEPPLYLNLGHDTNICGNNFILDAGNIGCTYLWNTGATTQTINITLSGTYYVKVSNNSGFSVSDTIIVNINPIPNLFIGNDTTLCNGDSVVLNVNNNSYICLWNTGANSQTLVVYTSGNYFVNITDNNGCKNSDTIIIDFLNNININIGNDTTICQGEQLVLNAGSSSLNYNWNTGQNTNTIIVSQQGKYWVSANYNNCFGSDTININVKNKTDINLGNDTIMCYGDLIILSPGLNFQSYLWSDNSSGNVLYVNNPGIYSVKIFDGFCYSNDEIFIDECSSEIWFPNVFTPNNDGMNELFEIKSNGIFNLNGYIYNRWGELIYQWNGLESNKFWNGKVKNKDAPDGVYYFILLYTDSKNKSYSKNGIINLIR